ncbi:MAG: hypothetical protein H8D92_00070 [Pelagibacteraceae bacterium]|nr:hypothetical protein [Pelagibacteraceae bacterium]
MVDPVLITVVAAVVGAGLNTLRGYLHSEEQAYSARKLAGALIISTFAAIAVAQTIAVEGVGLVGLGLIGLTTGFAADFAVSKAKKE